MRNIAIFLIGKNNPFTALVRPLSPDEAFGFEVGQLLLHTFLRDTDGMLQQKKVRRMPNLFFVEHRRIELLTF